MSDFTDLVKKLNAISNNEETVSATSDTVYKPVEEAVSGTRETVNILKVLVKFKALKVGSRQRLPRLLTI